MAGFGALVLLERVVAMDIAALESIALEESRGRGGLRSSQGRSSGSRHSRR